MLRVGRVSEDWKSPNIIAIYKEGKGEHLMNYRPVSLTSVVAKICERAVRDKWMEYLETKDIISDSLAFKKDTPVLLTWCASIQELPI